jgi:hypothetical protein
MAATIAGSGAWAATSATADSTGVRADVGESDELEIALDSVPDEYLVSAENAASLTTEIVEGSPLHVLTPSGEVTGVTITEVPTGRSESLVSLEDGQEAVTRSDGTTTVAQQKVDGSVQIVTTIESHSSPTEYSFDLGLPHDAVVELAEDGSVVAVGTDGSFVAGVHKPWAIDANGVPVPTHFTLDGNRLTQVISHDEDDAFPVVADPWLGASLYGRVNATNTSEGYVLTTTPTAWGALMSTASNISMWWAHADEVKGKVPRGYSWSLSLQEQLYCHIAGWPVSANPSYDLESWKPHVRWDVQAPSKCLGGYSPGS